MAESKRLTILAFPESFSGDGDVDESSKGHHIDVPDLSKSSAGQRLQGSSSLTEAQFEEGANTRNICAPWAHKLPYVSLIRKVVAEMISTFILVFTGCGAAMVDLKSNGSVTHLGVSLAFGIVVMVMVYAVGHISGAHMNPAVTLAFAAVRHFPFAQVPLYIGAQIVSSICAGFTLRLIFSDVASIGATLPAGSESQSFFLEVIITFILMFVVSAVATDTRAVGELAGIAVGSTVCLNAIFAGPISGASMNPARSIGPAVASNNYKSMWVYIVGPTVGAILGAWGYALIRGSEATPSELADLKKSKSLKR